MMCCVSQNVLKVIFVYQIKATESKCLNEWKLLRLCQLFGLFGSSCVQPATDFKPYSDSNITFAGVK